MDVVAPSTTLNEKSLGIIKGEPPKVNDICMIGYALSPSEFYMQHEKAIKRITEISIKLWERYRYAKIKKDVTKKYLSDTCGNYFAFEHSFDSRDLLWVRVEVVDWLMDDANNEVLIQLIDYGKKLYTNIKFLQLLPLTVVTIPRLAHRCHFGYLHPFSATKTNKHVNWSEDEKKEFCRRLGNINVAYFKILHCNYQAHLDSFEIDFINTKREICNKTIGQFLIETSIANPIINNLDVHSSMNYCAIMRELKIGCDNTVRRITYFQPLVKEFVSNEEPEPMVKVKAVGIPFFFVNVEQKEDITEPRLKALMQLLNSRESIRYYKKLDQPPVVGEIVLTLVRNTWYRARILSVKLENKDFDKIILTVVLTDYGEVAYVRLFNVRAISPEFLQMDFLFMACILYNLEPKHEDYNGLVLRNAIFEYCIDHIFQMTIMKTMPTYLEVLLKTADHTDVREYLIDNGYGQPIEQEKCSALTSIQKI